MERAASLRSRLEDVRRRLAGLAARPPAPGLTDPDPDTGERWDWGQVWAHLAEFPSYWLEQARRVAGSGREEPVPFGRTKTDPGRLRAIEADRATPVTELWRQMEFDLDRVQSFLGRLTSEEWSRKGVHPTLGAMELPEVVDRFLVGHLEEHAVQLEALAGRPEP
jgi:hypothetical protein